jgi:hypothetical protein
MTSKRWSSKGGDRASACWKVTFGRSAANSPAFFNSEGATSTPTTASIPNRCASTRVRTPVPQPISSTWALAGKGIGEKVPAHRLVERQIDLDQQL